jgi:dynein heavy chain
LIEIAEDKSYLDSLQEMRSILEHIDKNLENYLDKKRSQFPRFYFLSSDSLIDILSQSKEPAKI